MTPMSAKRSSPPRTEIGLEAQSGTSNPSLSEAEDGVEHLQAAEARPEISTEKILEALCRSPLVGCDICTFRDGDDERPVDL